MDITVGKNESTITRKIFGVEISFTKSSIRSVSSDTTQFFPSSSKIKFDGNTIYIEFNSEMFNLRIFPRFFGFGAETHSFKTVGEVLDFLVSKGMSNHEEIISEIYDILYTMERDFKIGGIVNG